MSNKSNVFRYGNIKDNPIVFIHGFPFDNYMWKYQIEYFSRNYYCITYDIKGLGEHYTDDIQFTIEDLVDQLEEIIKDTGVRHPIICGLSMGGYIALRAIERNEDNYRGLILCDTKSESDDDEGKLKRSAAIKKINSEGIQKFAEGFITPLFAPESVEKLGNEYISILSRSMNSDPSGVKACLLAMSARTSTTNYLRKIKIPVLVLSGEKDLLTPPFLMEKMALKIRGAEFHVVPGAGHLAPFEQPEIVNQFILKFLTANAD